MNLTIAQQQQIGGRVAPVPPEPEPPPLTYIPVDVTPSPNHGGNRSRTTGVVIHSTRSGQNWELAREFASTVSWFANPAAQVSAHAVVGGEGIVGFPIHHAVVGWHDPVSNATRLGIEVCQPTPDRPYTDRQYRATAALVLEWAGVYGYPLDRQHIVGHEETSSGISAGKSDPGDRWDWQYFQSLLTGAPVADPVTYTREQIVEISNAVADEYGIPRLALLALGIAESNLETEARRPLFPSNDRAFWPDVSAGIHQRAVRYSKEYAERGYTGEYPGTDVVEEIMDRYRDPWHSSRDAAERLEVYLDQSGGDVLGALARWNAPALNGGFKSEAHRSNYQRGIDEARRLLGG